MNSYGMKNIALAVLRQPAKDFKKHLNQRGFVENFLKSDGGDLYIGLLGIHVDGETILSELQNQAKWGGK